MTLKTQFGRRVDYCNGMQYQHELKATMVVLPLPLLDKELLDWTVPSPTPRRGSPSGVTCSSPFSITGASPQRSFRLTEAALDPDEKTFDGPPDTLVGGQKDFNHRHLSEQLYTKPYIKEHSTNGYLIS